MGQVHNRVLTQTASACYVPLENFKLALLVKIATKASILRILDKLPARIARLDHSHLRAAASVQRVRPDKGFLMPRIYAITVQPVHILLSRAIYATYVQKTHIRKH